VLYLILDCLPARFRKSNRHEA